VAAILGAVGLVDFEMTNREVIPLDGTPSMAIKRDIFYEAMRPVHQSQSVEYNGSNRHGKCREPNKTGWI
jgi:hypothetical protein